MNTTLNTVMPLVTVAASYAFSAYLYELAMYVVDSNLRHPIEYLALEILKHYMKCMIPL